MSSKETPKRVPKQAIVKDAPIILSKGHPDLTFLGDAIETDAAKFLSSRYLSGSFSGSSSVNSAIVGSGATGPSGPSGPNEPEVILALADIPSLSDIESITYEEYPDSNGVMKYRAVLKIRNSSVNKDNVAGIDARIYNPNATRNYIFGVGAASTVTAPAVVVPSSPFVANVTWHNAKSVCDPLGGVYGSVPYVAGTAQYREDGNGVPADSVSGPTRARIKSVWRKTEEEALEAAANAACAI